VVAAGVGKKVAAKAPWWSRILSEEVTKTYARAVTGILADLDLSFEVGKTEPEQKNFWALAPFSSNEDHSDAVPLTLLLEESWLTVFCLEEMQKSLKPEQSRTLLLLNPQVPLAKFGLIEEEGKQALWIGQQIPVEQINLESVKMLIGTITTGVRELRKRLKPISG
jgi:hypothetical protein